MTQLAICIGAPRSGTTWLFSQLRKSNSVFAPPVKEVRYLSGKRSDEQRLHNIKHTRETVELDADDERFLSKYQCANYTDMDEYADLMLNSTDKPWAMDLSPIYSTMSKGEIDKVSQYFNRDVKIILLVRDCVDRACSQANLHFHMHGHHDVPANHSEYMALLSSKGQLQRSNYPETIDNWVSAFGKNNFHLCFYEDLASDPIGELSKVLEFLDITADENMDVFAAKKVGSSKSKSFVQAPKTLKPLLAAQLFPYIDEMAKRYPEKCQQWRSSALKHMDTLKQLDEQIKVESSVAKNRSKKAA